MEIKLLLLKAISVIYYASYAERGTDGVANLTAKVMDHMALNDDPLETNRERSALLKLRSVLVWMNGRGVQEQYDLNDLMARIRVAVGDNDRLYDLFCTNLLLVDDPDAAKDKLDQISGELYEYIAIEELTDLLRKSSRKVAFDRATIEDLGRYRDELVMKLQNLPLNGKRRAASIARQIDISDVGSMAEVFHLAQTAIDPKAILKLPFKAANRMTGEQGGGRRGEWSNVSALPGQNKSGQLLDTFISMCIFNTPVLFDDTKKPLHVYTTIEDKLELVFQKLYVLLMQQEHGLPVAIRGVDPAEMADYVYRRLTANGWEVKIFEFPNGGDSNEYIGMLQDLEEDGYEIVSAGCDYVNLIGKQGIPVMVAGDDVQLLHRKIRAWTSPHNIFHYTAHQLSTDAKTLARQFPEDYLRKLPGKGYYEGCKKLDTEFDYEYMVAKTQSNGTWWQEVCWAKHRKLGGTLDADKYYALKFLEQPMIGFKYDVNLDVDLSYKKVGARTTAGEGGNDWRDFDE